jgi:hypothetical protein
MVGLMVWGKIVAVFTISNFPWNGMDKNLKNEVKHGYFN